MLIIFVLKSSRKSNPYFEVEKIIMNESLEIWKVDL